jgi:hypothetical protein
MARQAIPIVQRADWPPERALREVDRLLSDLRNVKSKKFNQDGENAEKAWSQTAELVFKHSFDSDSPNIRNLRNARSAGEYYMYEMSEGQDQDNFEARLEASVIAVNTAITDLKMSLPESEIQGVYEGGDGYEFCRDLRNLFRGATNEVLIVDPYLEDALFDLYVEPLPASVKVRVLTSNLKTNVLLIAKKFAAGRANFELSTAINLHDRAIFIDDRCWVVGQSIKDAAKKKATYVVEHSNQLMKPVYETIWTSASSQAKS